MYGDFIEEVNHLTVNDWLFFVGFTFFITVVLMNLLIAIIGDTYVRVMAEVEKS